jgi:hypothetical protein
MWFSSVVTDECRDRSLKKVKTAYSPILKNFAKCDHSFISSSSLLTVQPRVGLGLLRGSCPAPLFSILIYHGVWGLSLHYPATLGWVFPPSIFLRAWKRLISCMEIFHVLWLRILATWASPIWQSSLFKSNSFISPKLKCIYLFIQSVIHSFVELSSLRRRLCPSNTGFLRITTSYNYL